MSKSRRLRSVSRRQFLTTTAGGFAGAAAGLSGTLVPAAPATGAPAATTPTRSEKAGHSPFPADFAWGAATSAYQIEGAPAEDGKGPSVWDVFCKKPGAVFEGHTGDVACDHYHRFQRDIRLLERLGAKSYRFSVAWARVLPQGTGTPNDRGLDFYSRLVDEMLKAGIVPMCTLFHWDFPQALYKRGGWLNRDVAGWFADYAALMADKLGDRIKMWATQNEPQCFIGKALLDGVDAPGDKLKYSEYLTAAHNAMRAHGRAVQALRAHAKHARVGYVFGAQTQQPARPDKAGDVEAARWATFSVRDRSQWNNSWWADPVLLGHYPEDGLRLFGHDAPAFKTSDFDEMKQPLDFIGLNIYKSESWRQGTDGKPEQVAVPVGFPRASLDWELITPGSMYFGPRFFYDRYKLPIYITENGLPTCDQISLDGKVHDPQRIDYMHRYLLELGRAISDLVPVLGYYTWSLLDNFEWRDGYKHRFGLVHVDYQTQRRIPKDSFEWYRQVIASGGKTLYGHMALSATQVNVE